LKFANAQYRLHNSTSCYSLAQFRRTICEIVGRTWDVTCQGQQQLDQVHCQANQDHYGQYGTNFPTFVKKLTSISQRMNL